MEFKKWYHSNHFNWDCAPHFGFAIKLKNMNLFLFNFYGFKRHKSKYPYANKIFICFIVFGKEISFRVGIQNKTWVWLRWCELYNFYHSLKKYDF